MEKPTFGWIVASVAITAIATSGITRKPTGPNGAANAATSGTDAAPVRSPAPPSADDDPIDTLQLVGESLGVDLSDAGMRRRAGWSLRTLKAKAPNDQAHPNAVAFFKALLDLRITPFDEQLNARTAVDNLQERLASASRLDLGNTEVATDIDRLSAFVDRYFDRSPLSDQKASREELQIAHDYEGLDKTSLQIAILQQVLAGRTRVDFLIATLPDPIDSYTGWQFDPMLDAIAQAVGASDYVLDRFHFPDSDTEIGSSTMSPRGRVHEIEPGVVIFRRASSAGSPAAGDRLVLLIVHENPAAGIHMPALANAVRLVVQSAPLTTPGAGAAGAEIRILGPTFSGSSETLNRALQNADTRVSALLARAGETGRKIAVRIVSGSATDQDNEGIITSGFPSPGGALTVTYRATVHSDDVMLPALLREIKNHAGWTTPVAVLFESNTQYGRQLWKILAKDSEERDAPNTFIQLPFPMNISRLRTTVDAQDAAHSTLTGLPSRFRPLPMEAVGNPADQIPQFNPRTTATYVELALAGMLDTMRRERVNTVALMATDPRDKLFLAQQIAKYSPDVSIFTAESDSVYVHPDYSPYLRGALVVSTYPLFGGNQRWSYAYQGKTARRQFANGSAQGLYNAALALLDYHPDGTPIDPRQPVGFVEYGMPGEVCDPCTPPVWISEVGRSSSWPIRPVKLSSSSLFPVRGAPVAQPLVLAVFPSPLFAAVAVLLAAGVIAACVVTATRRRSPIELPNAGRHAGVILSVVGVMIGEAFVWTLCALRLRLEGPTIDCVVLLGAASLGLLAAGYLWAGALSRIADDRMLLRKSVDWRRPETWTAAAGIVAALGTLLLFLAYLAQQATGNRGELASYLARALDLGNGVSPMQPVLFLSAALALVGLCDEWGRRRDTPALADGSLQSILQELVHGDVKSLIADSPIAAESLLEVPLGGTAIVAAALVGSCAFAFDPLVSPLVSIDGPLFGRFVSLMLLLVQTVVALALMQFALKWLGLRRLLHRLAWHPAADAYRRLPRDLFPAAVFPRVPRLLDLQIPVAHCTRLAADIRGGALPSAIPAEVFDVQQTFDDEMTESPGAAWRQSKTWTALLAAALQAARALRSAPAVAPVSVAVVAPEGSLAGPPPKAPDPTPRQRQQELPAMIAALAVRDASSRLTTNLAFVVAGVVAVFCSHSLFPFQQHTQLEVVGWVYIAVIFTTILTVLVQIHRDRIITALTTPVGGEAGWDTAFVLKVVVFAFMPLLALFAAQFPDVGGVLLRWLEPVERALP